MVAEKHIRRVHAFTLIELLVVVAIIAMLISILLPSLAAAREQAKAAVCLSRLRNLGQAGQSYQTEYNGYIAGAPLTTGFGLAVYNSLDGGAWKPGMPMNTYDYTIPLLKQMSQKLSVNNSSNARDLLFRSVMTSGPMLCPSNNQMAMQYPKKANDMPVPATSYLTMSSMMRAGYNEYRRWQGGGLLGTVPLTNVASNSSWEVVPPDSYMPRIEAVGRASMKVYLADGLRYYDPSEGITYNATTTDVYGSQSGQPPCDVMGTTAPAREYNLARKFSYRHKRGTVIQAVMFDGHAEPLTCTVTKSAYVGSGATRTMYATEATGSAVNPKYYYPSGSRVNSISNLLMKKAYTGAGAPKTPFQLP